jgi:ribonuclease D
MNDGGSVSVDTEFLRERTYRAQLCLLQIAIGDDQYCIDVLAIKDLGCVIELLGCESVTKIFHAARQDMEVLYQTFNVMPKPIFDTQLAAAFCGLDMQIGYAALVELRLGITLEKSQSRTDWTRRPLSPEQIAYAGEDVAHLQALYQNAFNELESSGRSAWYSQEIEAYYDSSLYIIDPELAYQRLNGGDLNRTQQYTLSALAGWREATAQKKNIPRTWVLNDEGLYKLATEKNRDPEHIMGLGVFGKKSAQYMVPKILKMMAAVEVGDAPLWEKVDALKREEKKFCTMLMSKLKKVAEQQKISQALLATRKDVVTLYRTGDSDRMLTGWRRDIIGLKLLEYIQQSK